MNEQKATRIPSNDSLTRLGTILIAGVFAFGWGCGPDNSGGSGEEDGGGDGSIQVDTGPTPDASDPSSDDDGDGYTEIQGDCNDSDPQVHPTAEEVCDDGVDNDCDGAADSQEPDGDGDGWGPCLGDCRDDDPNVNPESPEIDGNGVDDNCDGIVDGDFDGDGYAEGQGDCDDYDAEVNPDADENCYDGVDNDCNGFADGDEPDGDGDGWGPCAGDCDDSNPDVNPGMSEIAGDGIDNNCDFLIDEDIDGDGWTETNGDCDDTDPAINPAVFENCDDGIDNNCDGLTDQNCLGPCELAELTRSSVGCVYYSVDCNNDPVEGYDSLQFAIVVSNTHATEPAFVEVQTRSGGTWQTIASATVSPISLHEFDLPDRHIDYTGVNVAGAYRVVSDRPVIAYQFQPVDGVSSFTSDASLLLPTSSLDTYYYVVGWGKPSYGNPQINIIAAEDGTTVTITPSVSTVAGGGIPALTAGAPYTYPQLLDAGDYLQIEGTDSFNGTYIESDKPVAVFSAHWCANIPQQNCCCDHLEEQVFGLQTWGKKYVAARHPVRSPGSPEPTLWHILASQNDTTVEFQASSEVTGLPAGTQTLQQGEVLSLSVSGTTANPGDFVVEADKPILVMEYLSSSYLTGAPTQQAGDPAMNQAVPVEQYLDSYVILVPPNWIYDYVVLVKPVGATIEMDNAPLGSSLFSPIDDGVNPVEWEVARLSADDGVHTFTGSEPFGIIVLGYDSYDSYAYPGGLNQQIINPIN
jgi:hypothetical protein